MENRINVEDRKVPVSISVWLSTEEKVKQYAKAHNLKPSDVFELGVLEFIKDRFKESA